MPMTATLADLPLAISAFSFFILIPGLAMDGAIGTSKGPKGQPLSVSVMISVSATTKREDS